MTLALTPMAFTAVAVALGLLMLPVVVPAWTSVLFLALLPALRRDIARQCLITAALVAWVALRQAAGWQSALLPERCEREPVTLSGETRGLSQPYQGLSGPVHRVLLEVKAVLPARCAGPRRVELYLDSPEPPRAGDRLRGTARLRRPWSMENPASGSRLRRYLVDDVHAVGSVRDVDWEPVEHGATVHTRLTRLRAQLSAAVRRDREGDTAALLAALAVGDQRFIGLSARERLRRFGLSHLVVISGMHISMLAALGWLAGSVLRRLLWLRFPRAPARALPHVLSLGAALVYGALSGFALPVQRALLMLGLVLVPGLLRRSLGTRDLLGCAVLLLVLLNPRSVLDASFWLSLGAVSLLLMAAAWSSCQGLALFLQLQLFMGLAMLPLSVFWFSGGAGVGSLANLLAIPLLSFCIAPLTVAGAAVHAVWPALASACWELADAVLRPCWAVLTGLEAAAPPLKLGAATTGLLLLPGVLGVLVLAGPAIPLGRICGMLLLLPMLVWRLPVQAEGLRLTFFDVGQGTAVLLEHAGQVLLYDTGGGNIAAGTSQARRSVAPYLRSRGYARLDYLVISHDDLDHNAGAPYLRRQFPPRHERFPSGSSAGSPACRAGRRESLGAAVTLRYLSLARAGDSDNNSSCVLMISAYGRRILLPGDIDRRRERELVAFWGDDLQADVLLAAHHGSASSSSALFLRAVDPRWVVISAARANRFGHPAAVVLRRIDARGAGILNTADRGAIVMHVRPDGRMSCRGTRHRLQPFWQRGRYSRRCDRPRAVVRGYNRPPV